MTKYIGILTSGGDSPGLNAAIRAIGKAALGNYGMRVIGFRDGFRGLMENRTIRLEGATLSGILTMGGTILGTSRDKPHKMPMGSQVLDMTEVMVDNYNGHHLDALVCLGGGGTQKNAHHLAQHGLNVITLPKTIDNDVAETDVTFGFDTALGIATEAVDRLHSTAHSHHRIIVVEIMGHNVGWLALGAGVAGGADVILMPEIPYDVNKVADAILKRQYGGKSFSIVAVSEGAMSTEDAKVYFEAVAEKEQAKGVLDMFSTMDEEKPCTAPPTLKQELSKREKLAKEKELLGFYLTGHPMDEYQALIANLDCHPFHKMESLDSGSVIKAAFIIESVKVKISAKSQKKFAILEISDGMERFELPIWPNIYEEKSHLLIENQLLCAILQVDQSEGPLRLHCRVLEDLTELDDAKVQMLNASFEQVKQVAKSESKRKRKQMVDNKLQEQDERKLHVTLDANHVTLSEIVKLKKLFHKFPGGSPLKLAFQSEEKTIGIIHVESKEGIGWNSELERKMEEFSFIQSFSFET